MTGTCGPLNAFLDLDDIRVSNAQSGPLAGLRLAVKDIYDVAGYRTGCGNPQKHRKASPASATAPAVQALLDSGARFVGRTQTDELAFSLMGLNAHFSSPVGDLLGKDGVLVLPTAPGAAPLKAASFDDLQTYRERALRLLCLSGLSGFPQITLPLGKADGAPFGLSLLGPENSDRQLLTLAARILSAHQGSA